MLPVSSCEGHGRKESVYNTEVEKEHRREPKPVRGNMLSKCRWLLRYICNSRIFNGFIIILIVANAITLAMDAPRASKDLKDVLNVCEMAFLLLFSVEMVLKMLAFGLVGRNEWFSGYFRDGWNCLDFLIVLVGCSQLTPHSTNLTCLPFDGNLLWPLSFVGTNNFGSMLWNRAVENGVLMHRGRLHFVLQVGLRNSTQTGPIYRPCAPCGCSEFLRVLANWEACESC